MKELSIEEKAKAYDKAIERLRNAFYDNNSRMCEEYREAVIRIIEPIFPELKESEDERIRKKLLDYLMKFIPHNDLDLVRKSKVWIAWLEKQGEYKPADKAKVEHLIPQKGMYYTCIKDYYSLNNTHLYVKGKVYKSFFNGYIDDESHFGLSWTNSCTEKYFEPTKDEDWIVCEHNNVIGKPMQYKEFKKKINQKFIENLKAKGITPNLKLWTIQDAKDGDVLCSGQIILLFKKWEDTDWNFVIAYAGIDVSGKLQITNGHWLISNDSHPATKEQRDTLFAKMKEADYEWDAENKELKKIENEIEIPFGAKDSELQEVTYFIPKGFHAEIDDDKVVIKKGEKPTAWSEEDEEIINKISIAIAAIYSCSTAAKVEKWLKSLKERYTWKPSEHQIASFKAAINVMNASKCYDSDLVQLLKDLEKLYEKD